TPWTCFEGDVSQVEGLDDCHALEPIVAADAAFQRRLAVAKHIPRETEPRRNRIPVDYAALRGEIAGRRPRAGRRALRWNRHEEAHITEPGFECPPTEAPRILRVDAGIHAGFLVSAGSVDQPHRVGHAAVQDLQDVPPAVELLLRPAGADLRPDLHAVRAGH